MRDPEAVIDLLTAGSQSKTCCRKFQTLPTRKLQFAELSLAGFHGTFMSGFFRLSPESLCGKPLSGEISVQNISHCPVYPAGFAGITLASMDPRVAFVEDVLGFRFENGFLAKYSELGEPVEDLEFWFRNAQVFRELLRSRSIPESNHHDLLTLIESIRIDAQTLFPPLEGLEDLVFNTSGYEFSEEVESCKAQVISLVLAQECPSYSREARN